MNEYLSNKIKVISFFSIIMVVFIHANTLTVKFADNFNYGLKLNFNFFIQTMIGRGICSIAVPMFSLISGFLFFYNFSPSLDNFKIKYIKRFKSLFIPYIFWSILGVVIYFILQNIPISRNFFNNKPISQYSLYDLLYTIFVNPLPFQFWFIKDLMLLVIITPVIYYLASRYYKLLFTFFLIIWIFDIKLFIVSNSVVLFFIIGSILSIKKIDLDRYKLLFNKKIIPLLLIWIFCLCIYTILCYKNSFPQNYINKLIILFGIIIIWIIYDKFIQNGFISISRILKLTKYTFLIFCMHEPMQTIIKKLFIRILGFSDFVNLLVYFMSPLITICIIVLTGYILCKYFNTFFKLITGGRG